MTRTAHRACLAAFLQGMLLIGATAAHAQTADAPVADDTGPNLTIVEVRVEGNRRVEVEAVKRALRNKEGRQFDPTRTVDDLKSLWALNYFSDIQLLVQRLPTGIAYVVRVTEKPSVREVRITGNDEISKDDFKDTIDIRPYSILDMAAIRRNAKKITDKYVEKGFFLAEVTWELKPVKDVPEVDIVFVVRENAKVMVKEINFQGTNKVNPEDLKGVMATKEGGWLSFFTGEGTYREEMFQRDLSIIQAAYYDRGFINVKVEKPVVSLSPDKRHIFISIKVEEGETYAIGKIDFSGDLLVTKEELHKRMVSVEGETFNRSLLARDIQAITDVYYDQGYAYANITPVTAVNAEKRTIDLTFDIQKGNQVYIERIDVVGNTKTRDQVIRRQMRVYEGELFSGTGMRRSKERITQLGFFETVEVSQKPGLDNQHVVVQVEVKEKSTGTFQVGLGFSNVENFIFTAQIAQNNFLGWGQAVSASAQLSSLRNFIQVSFYDQYFLDSNVIFAADFYRTQADYFGFIRQATGGSVTLGYNVLEDVMVNLAYTLEFINVEPGRDYNAEIPGAYDFGPGRTSAFRVSAQWDRRDNRLFATRGHLLFGSIDFAPDIFGGTFNYIRYTAYGRYYYPLPLGIVAKANLQVGYIQALPSQRPVLPISERYFLGGIQTLRGYALRTVSPTEKRGTSTLPDALSQDYPVGGDKQLLLNVELEFPIFEKVGIRGVVFFDAGNSFAINANFFEDKTYNLPAGLLYSVGFGFRWFSPIGPLRFEWGIPLIRRSNQDQAVLFEFTIGNSF